MQPRPENDLVYLLTILEAAGKIELYIHGFDNASDFYQANDQLNFNASLLLIATIGDQAAKISETTKTKYSHIPWLKIKNIRNRIVHDYVRVDFDIVFNIVNKEIPQLKINVEHLIYTDIKSGIFSLEELRIARNSRWYSHVDFSAFA